MKTLHFRRHSTKNPNNTLSDEGIELAILEGRKAAKQITGEVAGEGGPDAAFVKLHYEYLFHGHLVRTAQTALAFCNGLGYAPEVMPVIDEIGDDSLFAQIATPEFRDAVKGGLSNFEALLAVHGEAKAKEWAETAIDGVGKMLATMVRDKEIAIAFGHSPVIELAAWWVEGNELPDDFYRLSDMEGIVFVATDKDGDKTIRLGDKISVS